MFYVSIGDTVRLSHWPRGRSIKVIAMGESMLIASETVNGKTKEQPYFISEPWELVKINTDIPVFIYETGSPIPIGVANRFGNEITIKLADTIRAENFSANVDQASCLNLSLEYAPPDVEAKYNA